MNMSPFMAWLDARGLSIERFAAETGVGYTTVRGWAVDRKKPRAMARMIVRSRFPDCPLVARPNAPAGARKPLRLDRGIVRTFHGFPDEDQNEGHAEHQALSPADRIELTGFILRQYVLGILNLPELPRMDRRVVRIAHRGDSPE